MLHGDGEPLLIYYNDGISRFCYVLMKKDVSEFVGFKGILEKGKYYDLETPYGYGGPLADSIISEKSKVRFLELMQEYCVKNHIVSQFVRFHPLLMNYNFMPEVIETKYLRDTIYIDTENPELIMKNMDSKNRNMVRKAKKNGVTIINTTIDDYEDFMAMYTETMAKNNAEDYYTFNRDYFESLKQLKQYARIFYAVLEGKIISGSIMFHNDRYMHYHLSGSHPEYRQYSPGNLLLYEAACWASKQKIQQFHLGGGMSADDSLFGFKKQFNNSGHTKFMVGRTIFNQSEYDELKRIRKKIDPGFNLDNEFMIQYRK